jgi:hypothetical protein
MPLIKGEREFVQEREQQKAQELVQAKQQRGQQMRGRGGYGFSW